MQVYETLDEAWIETVLHLANLSKTYPSRVGGMKESCGYSFRIAHPNSNFVFNPVRRLSPSYAAAELLWYLSGSDKIDMIAAYAPSYKKYSDDGKTTFGAYGNRWRNDLSFKSSMLKNCEGLNIPVADFFQPDAVRSPLDQLQVAAVTLNKHANSRQAVVTCWQAGDLVHAALLDKKDLPCTLSLQFLARDGCLDLITTMRSNDAWLGLPYDVWCFTCIQLLMAEGLRLQPGWYQHQVGSMHLYEQHYEKALAANDVPFTTASFDYVPHEGLVRRAILSALDTESKIRGKQFLPVKNMEESGIPLRSLLGQVLAMAQTKWFDGAWGKLHNQAWKEFHDVHHRGAR